VAKMNYRRSTIEVRSKASRPETSTFDYTPAVPREDWGKAVGKIGAETKDVVRGSISSSEDRLVGCPDCRAQVSSDRLASHRHFSHGLSAPIVQPIERNATQRPVRTGRGKAISQASRRSPIKPQLPKSPHPVVPCTICRQAVRPNRLAKHMAKVHPVLDLQPAAMVSHKEAKTTIKPSLPPSPKVQPNSARPKSRNGKANPLTDSPEVVAKVKQIEGLSRAARLILLGDLLDHPSSKPALDQLFSLITSRQQALHDLEKMSAKAFERQKRQWRAR